ncbi:MAG: polysaccharide biosynthesis/export family protein [Verrucomicrobiae bacterium]|nr:polysaccharide biosynthesis/export family protein [Verrucomicrobiae bacterium]
MSNYKIKTSSVLIATGITCSSAVAQVFEIQRPPLPDAPKANAVDAQASSDSELIEAGTPKDIASTAASMATLDDERKLMIADVLSFQVLEDGEPAKRIIVTDSAEVDMPYIGRVKAEGRTCKDLAIEVKKRLEKDFYHRATVIIGLDYNAYGSRNPARAGGGDGTGRRVAVASAEDGYTLMGQVTNPGVFPLRPDFEFKLSHAILQSGGFQKFANNRRVRVLRKDDNGNLATVTVNLRDVMDKGKLEKDLVLKKGDVIIVDKKLFNF